MHTCPLGGNPLEPLPQSETLRDVACLDQLLPLSVFNLVVRSEQPRILDDASSDPLFVRDPYITQRQPKSIMCIPLVSQPAACSL